MAPAAPAAAPRRAPAKKAASRKGASAAAPAKRSTTSRAAKGSAAPKTRAQRNSRVLANARANQRSGAAPATRTAPARRKSGAATKTARGRTRTRTAAPAPSPVARILTSRGMPLLDRVLRGPAWVGMLGVLLAGIVFLNVSVLELNRGIAQTDSKAATLERTNSGLRERVAKLDSGERIQQLAAARGFVMPQPGDLTFVRSRASNAKLAAQRITPPDESTTTTTTGTIPTGTTAAPSTTTAPVQPAPTTQPAQPAPVAQITPAPTTQVP